MSFGRCRIVALLVREEYAGTQRSPDRLMPFLDLGAARKTTAAFARGPVGNFMRLTAQRIISIGFVTLTLALAARLYDQPAARAQMRIVLEPQDEAGAADPETRGFEFDFDRSALGLLDEPARLLATRFRVPCFFVAFAGCRPYAGAQCPR